MAPARCSVCHCYTRNCPPGLPNHQPVTAMGPNCTMNSLGRHFRNQEDTSNSSCDYEGCNFFTSGALYSNLPYPDDVSLGPLTDQQPPASVTPQQSELGQILSMLRDQKLESEKTNERMNMLQAQVNSILMPTTTTGVTVASTTPVTTTVSTSNSYSSPPTSAPNVIASAASNLAAALQGGLGHGNNCGHQGLTMNHLRADPVIMQCLQRLLELFRQLTLYLKLKSMFSGLQ